MFETTIWFRLQSRSAAYREVLKDEAFKHVRYELVYEFTRMPCRVMGQHVSNAASIKIRTYIEELERQSMLTQELRSKVNG